ncbi:MAG: aminomethyltransferase family protein [Alphaproteobacteria bacterium]
MTAAPYIQPLLETPLHARTAPLCLTGDWANWGGYLTVNSFRNVEHEYFAIRNAATLFDLSPMRKYRISGPDAERYLNRLLTRDVRKLKVGRVGYAVWCDDAGKVLDDGTVFRFGPEEFRVCAQERHLNWFLDSALGFEVNVADVSEDIAAIALQGPQSFSVLQTLGMTGCEALKPFDMAEFTIEGLTVTLSRTGFTGDLGYEIWTEAAHAVTLWDRLMAAGTDHGIVAIGSAALDLARMEAGFPVANVDFIAAEQALRATRRRSPIELGLDWLVDFGKGHFNGRRALLAERKSTAGYRFVGLDVAGNKPARDAFIYHGRNTVAGFVTSAMWSPTCKRNIALATLKRPFEIGNQALWAEIYVKKEGKWEKVVAPCNIVERPFFNPPRRRATPPLPY